MIYAIRYGWSTYQYIHTDGIQVYNSAIKPPTNMIFVKAGSREEALDMAINNLKDKQYNQLTVEYTIDEIIE